MGHDYSLWREMLAHPRQMALLDVEERKEGGELWAGEAYLMRLLANWASRVLSVFLFVVLVDGSRLELRVAYLHISMGK